MPKRLRIIITFVFLRHAAFDFLVKKKFFVAMKNKIHFFLVDFESDF